MKYFKLYEHWLNESIENLKMSDKDIDHLLELDKEYGDFFREFWYKWNRYDCKNLTSEYDKFIEARKKGECYYPQLELVEDSLDKNYLRWSNELKGKFQKFDCYLSQFYIENIDYLYAQAIVTIEKGNPSALALYNRVMCPTVSPKNYNAAWKMVNKNPYRDMRKHQPYTGKDIVSRMQKHIDKLGYKYNVVLDPYMVARQNVVPHKPVLDIKTDAQFSDIDVASLQVHEIEVHIARRHFGAQTGLNLFLDGLATRNITDEGLADYQSLHHNPKGVKANLRWDMAIKTVIGYHILDMDFCELFSFLIDRITTDQNKDLIDFHLFQNLVRFKRVLQDCKLLGGDSESEISYFVGYMLVKDMSQKEKDELLHWNVGPNHIKDIPKIKEFFEQNKFKPLYEGQSHDQTGQFNQSNMDNNWVGALGHTFNKKQNVKSKKDADAILKKLGLTWEEEIESRNGWIHYRHETKWSKYQVGREPKTGEPYNAKMVIATYNPHDKILWTEPTDMMKDYDDKSKPHKDK